MFRTKTPTDRSKLDMEVDHGFRLCLHERDFLAGYSILDRISNAVVKSRKVIFILSRCDFVATFQNLLSIAVVQLGLFVQ